jgi:hypothetical protein
VEAKKSWKFLETLKLYSFLLVRISSG